jgi:hypothetical protein
VLRETRAAVLRMLLPSLARGAVRCARAKSSHRLAWAGLVCAALTCTACSIAVDANRTQCSNSLDCASLARRGELAICDEGLCRIQPSEDGCTRGVDCPSDQTSLMRDASCTGPRCTSDAGRRDANVPLVDSALGGVVGEDDPIDAGLQEPPDEQEPFDDRDATLATAPEATVASECVTDQDCVALGRLGTQCVNGGCWKVEDEHPCTQDAECNALGAQYTDSKCVELSCVPNPRWRCEPPPEVSPSSEPLMLDILVRDSLSLSPLANIRALLCQKLDLDCLDPVMEVVTDRSGHFMFAVPRDFAGYLRFEERRYSPALYFFPAVLPSDGKLDPAPLLSANLINTLASSIGGSIDPERGHMMLIAEDCFSDPLSGVSFASTQPDETTTQFYVQDLLPSATAKETGAAGNGGFLNYPAGIAVLDVNMTKLKLKLTTFSVIVRPGFITVAYVAPESR